MVSCDQCISFVRATSVSYEYGPVSYIFFRETGERNSLITRDNLNTCSGVYEEISLEPAANEDTGPCECGVSSSSTLSLVCFQC